MNWTNEQKKAIFYNEDHAAIVSAAAGSGKTAVLVERVMRLLVDENSGVNADELVVSTFTVKAAAELRERLDRALSEALEKDPENEHLNSQILRLADASISTISSFCLDLIRKNSAALDMEPGFSVLEDAEASLLCSAAITDTLEEFCENSSEEDRKLIYDWYGGEDDSRLVSVIDRLYDFSCNLPDADAFFKEQLGYYEDPAALPDETIKNYYSNAVTAVIADVSELAARIAVLCEDAPTAQGAKFADYWTETCEKLSGAAGEPSGAAELKKLIDGIKPPQVPRSSKDGTFDNTPIKELKEKISKLLAGISVDLALIADRENSMRVCCPVLKILLELTGKVREKYSAAKRSRGKVDFDDIELLALKLLRGENGGPSAAAREIADGISVIIVDEFQDSNEIQYEIFRLISRDKKNLYFVGDIKQSIYRFRGADPLVFARLTRDDDGDAGLAITDIEEESEDSPDVSAPFPPGRDFNVISLNRNFRSNKPVIDTVNALFAGTMTKRLGDVDYNKKHMLIQGNKSYESGGQNRSEMYRIFGSSLGEAREKEAIFVANKIHELVSSGFEITDNGVKRPCGYGDIAVLMESYTSYVGLFKAQLDRLMIPYEAKDEERFTDNREIQLAVALLRVIDDPYRDNELAMVMMSPPYLFTTQEMAVIKLNRKGGKHRYLWSGVEENAEHDKKTADFYNEICAYREFAEQSSAAQLVRKIYDDSLMSACALASPNGKRRDANLRRLIRYAATFSGGENAGLYDFLRFIENVRREKVTLAQPQSAGKKGSAVRLMTIHSSKGLEFPICIVANVSSAPKKERGESSVVCDPVTGIGMKITDRDKMVRINTYMYGMVSKENRRLSDSERMRLLYVAATRPKEKLIFTVPLKAGTSADAPAHYGWIMNSRAVSEGYIDVTDINDVKLKAAQTRTDDVQNTVKLPDHFAVYAHSGFTEVPAKLTATQIGVKSEAGYSKTGSSIQRFLRVPSFLKTDGGEKLSDRKRGNAYHKVMEFLDFTGARGGARAQLDALLDAARITRAERESVSEDDIDRFLSSDLCARAVKSGSISREAPVFFEYTPAPGEFGIESWENEEKPFIQGIADMYFIENGDIILVDYKTNRGSTAKILTEEYRGQLSVYAKALTELTGRTVREKYIYSFELGEILVDD